MKITTLILLIGICYAIANFPERTNQVAVFIWGSLITVSGIAYVKLMALI